MAASKNFVCSFEVFFSFFSTSLQTARINEVLYEQKWYDSSVRFGKYTTMWLQGTNEPIRLTAYHIFDVNMKHFQDVSSLTSRFFLIY